MTIPGSACFRCDWGALGQTSRCVNQPSDWYFTGTYYTHDDGKEVIKVVSEPAGELSECVNFLGRLQRFFDSSLFCNNS